jgi:MFS transporter, DHA3 family, macrolide efflux protein
LKNRKALLLLFAANIISGFAQGITMLSVPWYFAQHQASSQFNLIYGLVTCLTLIWGVYAGAIVDRFNRKHVFLGTNIVECVLLLGIAGFGFTYADMPLLMVVSVFAITLLGYHIHYPNMYAFVQEVSEPKYYAKVNSYIEISGQVTNILAGTLAAFLLEGLQTTQSLSIMGSTFTLSLDIAPWKLQEIFLLDGLTYIIAICLIALIRYQPQIELKREGGKVKEQLIMGWKFLRSQRAILSFGIFSFAIFVAVLVSLHALMPMYISNHLEEGGHILGFTEALFAVGALIAGALIKRMTQRLQIPVTIAILMMMAAAGFFVSAITRSEQVMFILGFVLGFTNAGTRVLRMNLLFSRVPNQLIGRVNGIFEASNVLLRVLFILLLSYSFFSQGSNIIWGMVIVGGFILVSATIIWLIAGRMKESKKKMAVK